MIYFDWTYLYLVLPVFLFAMFASTRVNFIFDKYSLVKSVKGLSGHEAARQVLEASGVQGVRIERVIGKLNDHFDPKENVIRLSEAVYDKTSCAAIGVAAHEAGHAIQHAQNYMPIKFKDTIIPVVNFGSKFALPLFLVGLLLSYYAEYFTIIAYIGIIAYASVALFQLVTLPIEFDASKRALSALGSNTILNAKELDGAKKVLSAAALTYVAALAVSVMQILRLLIILVRRRN